MEALALLSKLEDECQSAWPRSVPGTKHSCKRAGIDAVKLKLDCVNVKLDTGQVQLGLRPQERPHLPAENSCVAESPTSVSLTHSAGHNRVPRRRPTLGTLQSHTCARSARGACSHARCAWIEGVPPAPVVSHTSPSLC